jgi:hypothetical protein
VGNSFYNLELLLQHCGVCHISSILCYSILLCSVLFRSDPFHAVKYCSVLFYFDLFCSVMLYSNHYIVFYFRHSVSNVNVEVNNMCMQCMITHL